jgi:CheY-like chemotaxis protein
MAIKKAKILLVDDDAEDREIIADAFREIQAETFLLFQHNGEEAINFLEANFVSGSIPCLIVLDLNMPRMNGTQTLRFLKSDPRFADIPVIIYSTSLNAIEKEECLQLGAHSYIIKPIMYKESIETAKMFYQFCSELKEA